MDIYFYVGMLLSFVNLILFIITKKVKTPDFYFDEERQSNSYPYGFTLIKIAIVVLFTIVLICSQILCYKSIISVVIPGIIIVLMIKYLNFIFNFEKITKFSKIEFFGSAYLIEFLFYFIFIPLVDNISLNGQILTILQTNIPFCDLFVIIYVQIIFFMILFNIILYFDNINYGIKKNHISIQDYRKKHTALVICGFIISGFLATILLNGQYIEYPYDFKFDRFNNVIGIYHTFLLAVSIVLSLNKVIIKNEKKKEF